MNASVILYVRSLENGNFDNKMNATSHIPETSHQIRLFSPIFGHEGSTVLAFGSQSNGLVTANSTAVYP